MIYLDHSATTKLTQEVYDTIIFALQDYANPSSLYTPSYELKNKIEKVREKVAKTINANPNEIYFTSGASESNSMVLQEPFYANQYEHSSIVNNPNLTNDISKCKWVSFMLVNNETGFVNDIKSLREKYKDYYFHCDATQGMGNMVIDVKKLGIDTMSFSGHKFHAPKGIGVLYVKKGTPIKPLIYGGKQEFGMRGGTENIIGILALGKALDYCTKEHIERKQKHCTYLRNIIINTLRDNNIDFIVNDSDTQLPTILSLSFKSLTSETILLFLNNKNIYISSGSACSSGNPEPSKTLTYLNIPSEYIQGTIRISLDVTNTLDDINMLLDNLVFIVNKFKG